MLAYPYNLGEYSEYFKYTSQELPFILITFLLFYQNYNSKLQSFYDYKTKLQCNGVLGT